jgi:hypothetical protein
VQWLPTEGRRRIAPYKLRKTFRDVYAVTPTTDRDFGAYVLAFLAAQALTLFLHIRTPIDVLARALLWQPL